jgi:catechol 2,3-dioxygenase-like lactoylglutathione lyase family enzyme
VSVSVRVESVCALLQVFDMPTSLAFWRDVLGFRVVQAAPPGDDCDWCLLRQGTAELMLNTQYERGERPPAADARRRAAHADVALFLGCRELDAAYAHLRARGVEVSPPVVRDYGMRQLSFRDPDGYGVCLQWRSRSADGGAAEC